MAAGSTVCDMTASQLKVRYALALVLAQLIAAFELTILIVPMRSEMVAGARSVFSRETLIAGSVLTVLGLAAVIVYAARVVSRKMHWLFDGTDPDVSDRRFGRRLIRNQTMVLAAIWGVAGLVLVAVNRAGGAPGAWLIGMAVLFGATTSATAALLLIQRPMRSIIAVTNPAVDERDTSPGILTRLLMMWLTSSALPTMGIAVLVVMRSHGWIIEKNASVEIPVIALVVISILVGLRGIMIAALSVSDPVRDVVAAMAEVEHGNIDVTVPVYERSEIGRLQSGFNRMVAGLAERDRLHDLFGRHVGPDVAQLAVSEAAALTGEVLEAGVLFIDLVDSTRLAQIYSPARVAEILNQFFRIVVAAVDEHQGSVNKFQGDAVLAVFGAPLPNAESASDALRAARALAVELQKLPMVDFGIGVSAGPVFAGNVGAEHRYEYTVIGDAVNEAARLADRAKDEPQRLLCSQSALTRARASEWVHWTPIGSEILRGRGRATEMSAPLP